MSLRTFGARAIRLAKSYLAWRVSIFLSVLILIAVFASYIEEFSEIHTRPVNASVNLPSSQPSYSVPESRSRASDRDRLSAGIGMDLSRLSISPARNQPTHADAACREKLVQRGIVLGSGPCVDIDAIVKALPIGSYHFNKPTYAYEDYAFNVILVLKTAQDQDAVVPFRNVPGQVTERQGPFSQVVDASLRGVDFKIEPSGPLERTVTSLGAVEWEWQVTPLNSGLKTLTIEVNATIMNGDVRSRVQLRVLREPIEVRISQLKLIRALFSDAGTVLITLILAAGTIIGIVSGYGPARRAVTKAYSRWQIKAKRQ